ncbi:MAG: hypothetical protein ACI4IS_03565 [Acutalibacteraceae bacterium]
MENFTQYLFVLLWAFMAVYLFVQGLKVNKICFVYSVFFLFMTGWYLADIIYTDIDMMHGSLGWVFRGIVGAVLLFTIIVAVVKRRKK